MKKELNKKLKLDSLNWEEVILGLGGKTTFRAQDIKRALKTTGRTFNANGPFYGVVRSFIEALGPIVTSKMEEGEVVYSIPSTQKALEAVGHKPAIKKPVTVAEAVVTESGFGITASEKAETSEKPKEPTDEQKILKFIKNKRSWNRLQEAICILSVFIKHGETSLSSDIIQAEMIDLGFNWSSFQASGKPIVKELLMSLNLYKLEIKKSKGGSTWTLTGDTELLDGYMKLTDLYKKMTGKDPKNLDDYITTKTTKDKVEDRLQILKEFQEKQNKTPRIPRVEEDKEVIWKKWLLIEALRNFRGVETKVTRLISWLEEARYFTITEEEAKKLCRELSVDTEERVIKYSYNERVSMPDLHNKEINDFYSPEKLTETAYVSVKLNPQEMATSFPEIEAALEDTTISGGYIYRLTLNRSFNCEACLKKLLRFIQISGKIYTEDSWMISRVLKIIIKDDSKERAKNNWISSLQS